MTEPGTFADPNAEPPELAPYDPGFPGRFRTHAARIASALAGTARRIDHVGSTSVPGLNGKPIIDVQVAVADADRDDEFAAHLEALGWPLRLRAPGHLFFRPPPGQPRLVHVHVCTEGSSWQRDPLLFRDYLRSNPDRAAAYSNFKEGIAARPGIVGADYTAAKTPFIVETLQIASVWAAETGWRPDDEGVANLALQEAG